MLSFHVKLEPERMAGRTRKAGPRHPSGKLKRPTGDPIAPAAWQRIRSDAAKIAGDPRLSSELGRLSFHREITDQQAAAGFKVWEIYTAFERAKRRGRSARSPNIEAEFRGDGGHHEPFIAVKEAALIPGAVTLDTLDYDDPTRKNIESTLAAERAFLALQEELGRYVVPGEIFNPRDGTRRNTARHLIERLCVDDRSVTLDELPTLRWLLDRLAQFFGIGSHKRGGNVGKIARQMTAPPARKPKAKRQDIALRTVLKAARPDLDDAQLNDAERMAVAVRDREAFRKQKPQRERG